MVNAKLQLYVETLNPSCIECTECISGGGGGGFDEREEGYGKESGEIEGGNADTWYDVTLQKYVKTLDQSWWRNEWGLSLMERRPQTGSLHASLLGG